MVSFAKDSAMESTVNTTSLMMHLSGVTLITLKPTPFTTAGMSRGQDGKDELSVLTKMQIILYILMAFAGSVGNTLAITVLMKTKFRNRKSSILLLNLAVCDALIATLCIPLDVGYFINGKWIYGKELCYVISPFQTSMPIVSSWTFMFMMLERNSLFSRSVQRQMRRKSVRLLALSTWIVPIALVIPYGIRLQYSEDAGSVSCSEKWENEVGRKLYTVILSVFEFLVPMLIITGFVIRICINLSRQSRNLKQNSLGLNQEKRKSRLKQNRNITMMFIVMVSLYATLKLPNNIFWQWNEFGDSNDEKKKHLIWTFVSLAAYSTSMVNPIVLAAMSKEFRQEFIYILRCQVFPNIEALCMVFRLRSHRSGQSTAAESSQGSLNNHPYKVVHLEMHDLGTTTSETNMIAGIALMKKSKDIRLITESTMFKDSK